MMALGNFVDDVRTRLEEFSLAVTVVVGRQGESALEVETDERPVRIRIDDGLEESYRTLMRARSRSLDGASRAFTLNNSVELVLARLDQNVFGSYQYELIDSSGNSVIIGRASHAYSLSHFFSDLYPDYFERRIRPRVGRLRSRRLTDFLFTPLTAVYRAKGRKTPVGLREIAEMRIRASLFKLAVEQNACFSIWTPSDRRLALLHPMEPEEDSVIPLCTYEEDAVNFYKVAKSSPFASQSFLAYYHVLEYYFLRVAEDRLHHRLRTALHDTKFRTDTSGLDKVIALVRGQDARADETEMLRNVLDKFVPEQELIGFINQVEARCGEKIYSKKRKIFGEQVEIPLRDGHALSNSARALKHIRNAIVHSSDRYMREDRHVPLSESEAVIEEFIPLIRFFAEKVICGTAT
jgi:hypothetical protein